MTADRRCEDRDGLNEDAAACTSEATRTQVMQDVVTDLTRRGFHIGEGLSNGSAYTLYRENPELFHADYCLHRSQKSCDTFTPRDLIRMHRMGRTTLKEAVVPLEVYQGPDALNKHEYHVSADNPSRKYSAPQGYQAETRKIQAKTANDVLGAVADPLSGAKQDIDTKQKTDSEQREYRQTSAEFDYVLIERVARTTYD